MIGALVAIACLGALVITGTLDFVWLIVAVVAGVAIGLVTSALNGLWNGQGFTRFVGVVWIAILGFNAITNLGNWFTNISFDTGLLAAISIVMITIIFAILLRAPTVQGRKVMDEIEGFKMYLDTAEKNRLNFVNEPPMTVDRFERILPYAIALGVEKPWSERFEGELARHADPGRRRAPTTRAGTRGRNWSSSSGGFSNTVNLGRHRHERRHDRRPTRQLQQLRLLRRRRRQLRRRRWRRRRRRLVAVRNPLARKRRRGTGVAGEGAAHHRRNGLTPP